MKEFTWQESYSCGNEKLDAHNKELLKLLNDLYDHTLHIIPSEAVDKIIDYISYHFSEEEEVLIDMNYPNRDNHIKQHRQFIDDVVEMTEALFDDKLSVISIRIFLKEWFQFHIKREDRSVYLYQKELKQLHQKYTQ